MGPTAVGTALVLLTVLCGSGSPARVLRRCPPDSVRVGTTCVDKYEASAWSIPPENADLIRRVRMGIATLGELNAAGATQRGTFVQAPCTGQEYPAEFPVTGNWIAPVYAVSVAGVLPSTCLTWFQAEQACRLADKRLVSNEEWQAAAAGTPDPNTSDDGTATCATKSAAPATTGGRSGCVSLWGAHDMVGNVWEWTSTWSDQATGCVSYDATYGTDYSCSGSNAPDPTPTGKPIPQGSGSDIFPISLHFPAAVIRGGNFSIGERSGVFAFYAGAPPFNVSRGTGFRCAR